MKLYAKVTSERATKGQGGNDFIEVALFLEGQRKIGDIYLDINDDVKNHGSDMNEWIVSWKAVEADNPAIISQGHYVPQTKGKKQKDEISAPRRGDWIDDGKDDTY